MSISHVSNNQTSHSVNLTSYVDQPSGPDDFDFGTLITNDTNFDTNGYVTDSDTLNATGAGAAAAQVMLNGALLGKDGSYDAIVGAKMSGDLDCAVVSPTPGRSSGSYCSPFCVQSDNFQVNTAGTLTTTLTIADSDGPASSTGDTVRAAGKNCWLEGKLQSNGNWEVTGSHIVGGVTTSVGPTNVGSSLSYSITSAETVAVNDTFAMTAVYYGNYSIHTTNGTVHADIEVEATAKAKIA